MTTSVIKTNLFKEVLQFDTQKDVSTFCKFLNQQYPDFDCYISGKSVVTNLVTFDNRTVSIISVNQI